jgi:hypothetical protein
MKNNITGIDIITQREIYSYTIGKKGITEIKDVSFSDQIQHHYVFEVYEGDRKVRDIINCPVEVFYEK